MGEEIRVLLVDDEEDILEIMEYNLKKHGFEVVCATNGEDAIKKAQEWNPHIIVLDIMMPNMDGITLCKELRSYEKFKDTIIIFLTARTEDFTQIIALENGGDDYITKPITPQVFVTKIKTYARRLIENQEIEQQKKTIHVGSYIIDLEKYEIIHNQKTYYLPRKEFQIVVLLATSPGKVFSRDEIYAHVWGDEVIVGERTIDVHMRKIRKKLGNEFIETIKGVGYRIKKV
ncbi:MAG: response regulator transcription factor [Bacteroidales bacterium]|nr:response regulator transcription factor [Bacteroidales bacterium]